VDSALHISSRTKWKSSICDGERCLSAGGVEGEIRRKVIEDDLVYGIVATPPKLFYTVSLPSSLCF